MMKKNEECLPLEYLKHENTVYEYLIGELFKNKDGNLPGHIGLLKDEFFNSDPDDLLFSGIAGNLSEDYPYIYKLMTSDKKHFGLNPKREETIRKIYIFLTVLRKWEQSKIIYKLDEDFGNDLINTENLRIRPEDISYLPFSCFYIDLSNINVDAAGVFIKVLTTSEKHFHVLIYVIGLNADGICQDYLRDDYAATFSVDLPENKLVDGEYWSITRDNINTAEITASALNDILFLVFQFIAYITSKEPDVTENEVTKRTYRPSSRIKNKFSEVRQWDIGVRYGKAIRLNQQSENQNNTPAPAHSTDHNGTPKRPHMRCAHWCHYHTGKGRKNTICKWIAPIFVTGKSKTENQDFPAVIHQVTK